MQPYLKHIHRHEPPPAYLNERSWEYAFVLQNLIEDQCKTVLDVGVGAGAFSAVLRHAGYDVTALDSKGDYWQRFENRHVHVVADDIRSPTIAGPFDAVVAVSTLEHIEDADAALAGMVSLLATGGTLLLTFPYSREEYSPNVYARFDSDALSKKFRYIAQSFCDEDLARWSDRHHLVETRREYLQGWSGKFWRTGDRIRWPRRLGDANGANAACVAFRKTH